MHLDIIFNNFANNYALSCTHSQRQFLLKNKNIIIKQALENIGLAGKKSLSAKEAKLFKNELSQIVHFNGQLPSFLGKDELEDSRIAHSEEEKYAINARNLLKHLSRGVPISSNDGEDYSKSFLATNEIIDTLLKKRDAKMMKALRTAMQELFSNALAVLQSGDITADNEKQYQAFQSTLMSSYPFMDPEHHEQVVLPQKIKGVWQPVTYQFERLDISPQSGILSAMLEEEDRIYAFGLTTSQQDAESHLLLMGTTYPAGQGAALAVAYNFYPLHSVGEGHDTAKVDQWINNQNAVKITGHSKGATMAMITAVRHSDKITQADCLNPTALSGSTLDRLKPIWKQRHKTPQINVYAQAGDCVFQLEKGFLEGTNLYRVIPNTDKSSMNCGAPVPLPNFIRKGYEAHIHHFLGRSDALVLRMSVTAENKSKWREFRNDIKYLLNWLRFPLEFLETAVTILARKAKRFYERHPKMIKAAIIVASLVTLGALVYSGLLLPAVVLFAKPVMAKLGLSLSYGAACGITAALSVMASFLMPYILQLANKIITAAAKFANTALGIGVHLTAITLGSLSAVKIGLKSLCNNKSSTALIIENSAVSSQVMPAGQKDVGNAIKSVRRQSIGGAFFNPMQDVIEPKKIEKVLVRRKSLS